MFRSSTEPSIADSPERSSPAFIGGTNQHLGRTLTDAERPALPELEPEPARGSITERLGALFRLDKKKPVSPTSAASYPTSMKDYEILAECGSGMSSVVFKAHCRPLKEIVAVKRCRIEYISMSLDELAKEAQMMRKFRSGRMHECRH